MSAETSRDDADFWDLTPLERVRFHARLTRYYARRSRHFADKVERGARLTMRLAVTSISLALLALVPQLLKALGVWP